MEKSKSSKKKLKLSRKDITSYDASADPILKPDPSFLLKRKEPDIIDISPELPNNNSFCLLDINKNNENISDNIQLFLSNESAIESSNKSSIKISNKSSNKSSNESSNKSSNKISNESSNKSSSEFPKDDNILITGELINQKLTEIKNLLESNRSDLKKQVKEVFSVYDNNISNTLQFIGNNFKSKYEELVSVRNRNAEVEETLHKLENKYHLLKSAANNFTSNQPL